MRSADSPISLHQCGYACSLFIGLSLWIEKGGMISQRAY
jgi:hypothetical protein